MMNNNNIDNETGDYSIMRVADFVIVHHFSFEKLICEIHQILRDFSRLNFWRVFTTSLFLFLPRDPSGNLIV